MEMQNSIQALSGVGVNNSKNYDRVLPLGTLGGGPAAVLEVKAASHALELVEVSSFVCRLSFEITIGREIAVRSLECTAGLQKKVTPPA